jgi:hypothetical protein
MKKLFVSASIVAAAAAGIILSAGFTTATATATAQVSTTPSVQAPVMPSRSQAVADSGIACYVKSVDNTTGGDDLGAAQTEPGWAMTRVPCPSNA